MKCINKKEEDCGFGTTECCYNGCKEGCGYECIDTTCPYYESD